MELSFRIDLYPRLKFFINNSQKKNLDAKEIVQSREYKGNEIIPWHSQAIYRSHLSARL